MYCVPFLRIYFFVRHGSSPIRAMFGFTSCWGLCSDEGENDYLEKGFVFFLLSVEMGNQNQRSGRL